MLPALPSVSASSAAYGGTQSGGPGWQQADWTINIGGSGTAYQSATGGGGVPLWVWVAGAVGAAWLLIKR